MIQYLRTIDNLLRPVHEDTVEQSVLRRQDLLHNLWVLTAYFWGMGAGTAAKTLWIAHQLLLAQWQEEEEQKEEK